VLEEIPVMRRRRALASHRRSGTFAHGRVRREHRAFVRRNWRLLLVAVALFAVATAIPALLVQSQLVRGVIVSAGVAGSVGALVRWVVLMTGTAPRSMGEVAEQWTARELRTLLKRG
jgi:hypothetical protein